jgi:hypothetical protein
MYDPHAFRDVLHHDGFEGSWLDWFLRETETMHGALAPSRHRCVAQRYHSQSQAI